MPTSRARVRSALLAALVTSLASCKREAPAGGTAGTAPQQPDAAAATPGNVYERGVVFVGSVRDSTIIVPWLFTSRTKPGGVDRTARAWLERGGEWEPFFQESWETEPTRAPFRLHPRGALRLIMADGGALEAIVFEGGPRRLELEVGAELAAWSGSQFEDYLVAEGAAILADRRIPGLVLDLQRQRRGEAQPGGDWIFLTSGDSVQVVLAGTDEQGGAGPFEGWARIANQPEVPPRDVSVSWVDTRQFEQARREVPVRWRFTAPDGDLSGDLEAKGTHIEAGEGQGPIMPVDALFEVTGTVRVGDVSYPARGLVRHVQR